MEIFLKGRSFASDPEDYAKRLREGHSSQVQGHGGEKRGLERINFSCRILGNTKKSTCLLFIENLFCIWCCIDWVYNGMQKRHGSCSHIALSLRGETEFILGGTGI
jgi:hypothetical protein